MKFRIIINTGKCVFFSSWLDAKNFTIESIYNIVNPLIKNNITYIIEYKEV